MKQKNPQTIIFVATTLNVVGNSGRNNASKEFFSIAKYFKSCITFLFGIFYGINGEKRGNNYQGR